MQYEGPGVELAFPHLDQSDPLLLLQLQHRYTAMCLALKHSLRYTTLTSLYFCLPGTHTAPSVQHYLNVRVNGEKTT